MAQILPLSVLSRLVTVQALLDRTQHGDSELARCLIIKLKSDCYTAVTSALLIQIVQSCPASLNNTLLLALAPPHLRQLELNKCYYISSTGIERVLKRCTRLEHLNLEECNQLMRPTFFRLCGHFASQLMSLSLDNCDKVTDEVVKSALQSLPSLRKLSLSQCENITDEVFLLNRTVQLTRQSVYKIRKPTGYQYHLTDVNVSGCHGLTSSSIRHLTTLCGPSLRHLDISWTKMDCTALWYLSGFSLASAVHFALSIDKLQLENELAEMDELVSEGAASLLEKEKSLSDLEKVYEAAVCQLNEADDPADAAEDPILVVNDEDVHLLIDTADKQDADGEHPVQASADLVEDNPPGRQTTTAITESASPLVSDDVSSCDTDATISCRDRDTCSTSGPPVDVPICQSSTLIKSPDDARTVAGDEAGGAAAGCDSCVYTNTEVTVDCMKPQCELVVNTGATVPGQIKRDRAYVVNHSSADSSVWEYCDSPTPKSTEDLDKLYLIQNAVSQNDTSCSSSEGSVLVESDHGSLDELNAVTDSVTDKVNNNHDSHNLGVTYPASVVLSQACISDVATCTVSQDSLNNCSSAPELSETPVGEICDDGTVSDTESDAMETQMSDSTKYQPAFNPSLLSLDIANLHFPNTDLGNACLKAFFTANPNIQSFTMTWKGLRDDMLVFIADHAPKLTHLSLVECDGLSNLGVSTLASKCQHLRTLNMQAVNFISDPALMSLAALGNLTSLNVAESNITDRLLHKTAACCSDRIRELDLSWCEEITVAGLDAIAKKCQFLERFSVRQCPISLETLGHLTENCKRMKELNLSSLNCITDQAIVSLALSFHHLTRVDFSWNMDVTNLGVHVLLSACVHLTDAVLTGIKRITSSPFLPIISNLKEWKKCQALMRFKRHERDVFSVTGDPHLSSSDEEFEALCIPQRSTCYVPHLRFLDVVYCDKVNDSHMASLVAVCRGTLTVRDYYGQNIQPSWITCQSGQAFIAPTGHS